MFIRRRYRGIVRVKGPVSLETIRRLIDAGFGVLVV